MLDLRGNIPTFIHIPDSKLHDVNVLDILLPEAGAFYIMDSHVGFYRLFTLNIAGAPDFDGSLLPDRPQPSKNAGVAEQLIIVPN